MNPAPDDALTSVSPERTLREVGRALPEACKRNVVVIGSLAVGYHYLRGRETMVVRTKDADCLLSPFVEAVPTGRAVLDSLFGAGWTLRENERWPTPGGSETPLNGLPAPRLRPPGRSEWFVELLTVPSSPSQRERRWTRLETDHGHFGLCSFGFVSLTTHEPVKTEFGLLVARPEVMALAHLLEHPRIRPERMSGLIAGRSIKRSNKDLGRVLAIAHLATSAEEDVLLGWPDVCRAALRSRFPVEWRDLCGRAGEGLRALLASEPDLEEARHSLQWGLLASQPPTRDVLITAGLRVMADAIEPLESVE